LVPEPICPFILLVSDAGRLAEPAEEAGDGEEAE